MDRGRIPRGRADGPTPAPRHAGGAQGRRSERGQRQPPRSHPQAAAAAAGRGRRHPGEAAGSVRTPEVAATAAGRGLGHPGQAAAGVPAELRQRTDEVADLLRRLRGQVVECSRTAAGCRLVQDALGLAQKRDQKLIVQELQGHVCELLECPHGNHVLQLAVELLPPEAVDFVCSEILHKWNAATLARQPYGCRVLERLIEHFPARRLEGAVAAILCKVESLSDDRYGNFVIRHLLEHGTEGNRKHIAETVRSNVAHFNSGFACGVLDMALTYSSWGDQLDIARQILEQEPLLATLATNAHGFASVQRLFTVAARASGSAACGARAEDGEGGLLQMACQQLLKPPLLDAIRACKHGQCLLNEVLPEEYLHSAGKGPARARRIRGRLPAESAGH